MENTDAISYYLTFGEQLEVLKDFSGAFEAYTAALEKDPFKENALCAYAGVKNGIAAKDGAIADLSKAGYNTCFEKTLVS